MGCSKVSPGGPFTACSAPDSSRPDPCCRQGLSATGPRVEAAPPRRWPSGRGGPRLEAGRDVTVGRDDVRGALMSPPPMTGIAFVARTGIGSLAGRAAIFRHACGRSSVTVSCLTAKRPFFGDHVSKVLLQLIAGIKKAGHDLVRTVS
eukprot:6300226-Prymnesium_polylepis.3